MSETQTPIVVSEGDSQIVLYAKGHFKRTDVMSDLKVLVGYRCGFGPELVSENSIFQVLHIVADKCGLEKELGSRRFLSKVMFGSEYGPQALHLATEPILNRYVDAILGLLVNLRIRDKDITLVQLSPANYTLLPPALEAVVTVV
jgi:hypothetical protein